MAKIKDILAIESQRMSLDQCRVVYLFPEGTFYRAYEWSAWLCVRYIQQFKPTKRFFKNENTSLVFIGFPFSSLEKYIPEGAEVSETEDRSVRLILPAALLPSSIGTQDLASEYGSWKQSVSFVENAKKNVDVSDGTGSAVGRPYRLTDLLHTILAFPIEQRTPLESMAFLADMKKEIAEII